MRQYKIMAGILLILPIVNFAFARPIAAHETHQVRGDVVPDAAITMWTKRAEDEIMEKQWDRYFERLPKEPESSSAAHPPSSSTPESDPGPAPAPSPASSTAPDYGSMDPPQVGTSKIEKESPELTKSLSFDHFLKPPSSSESSPGSEISLKHLVDLKDSESGSFRTADVESESSTTSSTEKPKSKSFLRKLFSKLKFWRRISGPGSVGDAVNAARRELQGLVDTGATMIRDIGKSLYVPPTPATRGVPGVGQPS